MKNKTTENEPFIMFKAERFYEKVTEVTILRRTDKKVYFSMPHDHRKECSELIEATNYKYFQTKDEALHYLLDKAKRELNMCINRVPILQEKIHNLELQLSSNNTKD